MKNKHALIALATAGAFGLAACGSSSSTSGSATTTTAGGSGSGQASTTTSSGVAAESLATGNCFNSGLTAGSSGNVKNITRIDCAQAHQYEVIATQRTTLGSGGYPGDSALNNETTAYCKDQFKSYVGIDYSQSNYGLQPVYPTQGSWNAGDRTEQCWVHGQNGATLTGSVQGTAR